MSFLNRTFNIVFDKSLNFKVLEVSILCRVDIWLIRRFLNIKNLLDTKLKGLKLSKVQSTIEWLEIYYTLFKI